jgi:hypothetical protein
MAVADDTTAALSALGVSLRKAAAALAQAPDDDGVAALGWLYDLFDALEEVPALAAEAPRLVAVARPGQRPAEQLDRLLAELTTLHARLRDDRAALKRLAAAEDDLREGLEDHAELRERIAELRRLERLVDALDALSGQQRVVDERLQVLRDRDGSAERTLTADCDTLVRLTEEQLDALGSRTREVLHLADERGRQLAAQERELARVTSDLDELGRRLDAVRAELGERIPQLERYARADRELAEALSAWDRVDGDARADRFAKGPTVLERARADAAEVEQRLAAIDRVLREALEQGERTPAPASRGQDPGAGTSSTVNME